MSTTTKLLNMRKQGSRYVPHVSERCLHQKQGHFTPHETDFTSICQHASFRAVRPWTFEQLKQIHVFGQWLGERHILIVCRVYSGRTMIKRNRVVYNITSAYIFKLQSTLQSERLSMLNEHDLTVMNYVYHRTLAVDVLAAYFTFIHASILSHYSLLDL